MSTYCTEDEFSLEEQVDSFGFASTIAGPLPVSLGGTGQTSDLMRRVNLSLNTGGFISQYSAITDLRVTGTLPVANGGTGATTAEEARATLGIAETTAEASGPTARVRNASAGTVFPRITAKLAIDQPGSDEPTPSSPRPIRAYPNAAIYHTQRSLSPLFSLEQGGISGGADTSGTNQIRSSNYIFIKPGRYFSTWTTTLSGTQWAFVYYTKPDPSGWVGSSGWVDLGAVAEVTDGCYVRMLFRKSGSAFPLSDFSEWQLWSGSLPGAYKSAGEGEQATVTWSPITVDGTSCTAAAGVLDVTHKTLTVTHAAIDLGSMDWMKQAGGRYMYASAPGGILPPGSLDVVADICCSHLPAKTGNEINSSIQGVGLAVSGNVRAFVDGFDMTQADVEAAFKAYVSGWTFVYELSTPVTVSVTCNVVWSAYEVENNVWTDTGDATVRYQANAAYGIGAYVGKRLSVLGDSISTFAGWIPAGNHAYYPSGTVTAVEDTWWHKVMTALGMVLDTNESWGGSRVAGASEPAANLTRCEALGSPDVVIFYMGINDFDGEVGIGTWDGTTALPTDNTTFREAYAITLNKIMTKYPTAEVWCCTLPQCERNGEDGFPEINGNGVSLSTWNKAITEIASAFGARVLHQNQCGLTYQNMPIFDPNELHPTKFGHSLLANNAIREMDPTAPTRWPTF